MNPIKLIQAVFLAGLFAIVGVFAYQRVASNAGKAFGAV